MDKPPLPASSSSIDVHLLDGGSFTASWNVIHFGDEYVPFRMFSWCFVIHHAPSGRRIIWDVGLSDNREDYSPTTVKTILDILHPVAPKQDLPQQLRDIGVQPEDIDTVIFSHAHWDHSRPIRKIFPKAVGVFGPGTFAHCCPGHLQEGSTDSQWNGHFFDPNNSTENCKELQGPWIPFGPFDEAMDIFGDQSFWVFKAPGHMPGNICACVRTRSADWVVLGSDCCHSRQILDGKTQVATWCTADGSLASLHEDIEQAKATIVKIKELEDYYGAHVALAHDDTWMRLKTDKVLMSLPTEHVHKLISREFVEE